MSKHVAVTLDGTLAFIADSDGGKTTTRDILEKYHLVGTSPGQRSRVSKVTMALIKKGLITKLGPTDGSMAFKITKDGREALKNVAKEEKKEKSVKKEVKVAKPKAVAKAKEIVKAKVAAKTKKQPVPAPSKAKPILDKQLYAALKAKGIDEAAIKAMEKAQMMVKSAKAEIVKEKPQEKPKAVKAEPKQKQKIEPANLNAPASKHKKTLCILKRH